MSKKVSSYTLAISPDWRARKKKHGLSQETRRKVSVLAANGEEAAKLVDVL